MRRPAAHSEDLVESKKPSPERRARLTRLLAGSVGLVLLVPLCSLLIRRKPIIPDEQEGYRAMTQLTGMERVTPRIKLELPPEFRKAPEQPQAAAPEPPPAAAPKAIVEAAPRSPPPPPRKPQAFRARRKKPLPPAGRPARLAKTRPKVAPKGPTALAWQPGPAEGLEDVFWAGSPKPSSEAPAPKPQAQSDSKATPQTAPEPAASPRAHGRRAEEPPEVPALSAPKPEEPCPQPGAWRNTDSRQCFPSRRACELDGGPCEKGGS